MGIDLNMNKKKQWPDWSDFYEDKKEETYVHRPSALWVNDSSVGVAPKSNTAEPTLKKGEVPRKPSNEEIANYILKGVKSGPLGQWKDSDHLHREVVTEAQAKELQKNWENAIDNFYKAAQSPVNPQKQDTDWGSGKSFNSTLTEEERLRRNMFTGE